MCAATASSALHCTEGQFSGAGGCFCEKDVIGSAGDARSQTLQAAAARQAGWPDTTGTKWRGCAHQVVVVLLPAAPGQQVAALRGPGQLADLGAREAGDQLARLRADDADAHVRVDAGHQPAVRAVLRLDHRVRRAAREQRRRRRGEGLLRADIAQLGLALLADQQLQRRRRRGGASVHGSQRARCVMLRWMYGFTCRQKCGQSGDESRRNMKQAKKADLRSPAFLEGALSPLLSVYSCGGRRCSARRR